jgi:RNA polymerase sigma-70 factor (ECF subfamily)
VDDQREIVDLSGERAIDSSSDNVHQDDVALALSVRQGDHDAFQALYDRYASSVLGLAQSVVRDRGAAEDVTHDVFLGFWRNPHSFEPGRGHFVAWLLRVTRNRSIDVLRKRRDVTFGNAPSSADGDPIDPTQWLQDKDPSPEVQAISRTLGGRVREALKELPPEHRILLELAYFGGLTQREIAERLNRPLGTVKTQMRTSLKRLSGMSDMQEWATSNTDDQIVEEARSESGAWNLAPSQSQTIVGPETS